MTLNSHHHVPVIAPPGAVRRDMRDIPRLLEVTEEEAEPGHTRRQLRV